MIRPDCCRRAARLISWRKASANTTMYADWELKDGWALIRMPSIDLEYCPFCGVKFKPPKFNPPKVKDEGVKMEDIEDMMKLKDSHSDAVAVESPPSKKQFTAEEVLIWALSNMKAAALAGKPIETHEALIQLFDEEYEGEEP